jgi:hypothetical protein
MLNLFEAAKRLHNDTTTGRISVNMLFTTHIDDKECLPLTTDFELSDLSRPTTLGSTLADEQNDLNDAPKSEPKSAQARTRPNDYDYARAGSVVQIT